MTGGVGSGTGARKRFYKEVAIAGAPDGTGFRVLLDGRGLRTPAKRELKLSRRALAEAVAAEWRTQGATIDPATMPLTRLVNSALDGVADKAAEVRAGIVAYGGSDLICYLAEGPRELIERQSRAWGQVHAWLKEELGVELALAAGVMPVAQDAAMLARLDAALGERDALELAATHVITTLTGSLLLALAVLHRRLSGEEAWRLAHIDEDFQIEKWGEDAEAAARRAQRWVEMQAACTILASAG